jgi:hypothetical protein
LRSGAGRGEIRSDVDAAAYAALLVGALRGVGFQVLADPGALDVAAVADALRSDVERALRAGRANGRVTRRAR